MPTFTGLHAIMRSFMKLQYGSYNTDESHCNKQTDNCRRSNRRSYNTASVIESGVSSSIKSLHKKMSFSLFPPTIMQIWRYQYPFAPAIHQQLLQVPPKYFHLNFRWRILTLCHIVAIAWRTTFTKLNVLSSIGDCESSWSGCKLPVHSPSQEILEISKKVYRGRWPTRNVSTRTSQRSVTS